MRGRSIGSLVVTEAGRAIGIITITDLLELLGRGLDRPVETTTRRPIGHRAPHRKRHRSSGSW
jgi:CBS domain-containing protein